MSLRCGHCGRENTRETKGSWTLSSRTDLVPFGQEQIEVTTQWIAQVDLCSACNKPTLLTYHWVDEFMDPTDDIRTNELYPEQHDVEALPEGVSRRYAQMLAIRHEADAFAMRAGKTLEAVCADQGFPTGKKNPLARQLKALVERGGYPQSLAEQALIVKEYRNIASHDDAKLDVEEADVPLIVGFVDGMLDFLYRGPARLRELADRLERRREVGR
jgi:hypothetical protein